MTSSPQPPSARGLAPLVIAVACSLAVGGCATAFRPPPPPPGIGFESVATGPGVPSPAADTDGDGIEDIRETALGSDPARRDTDGDGFDDGFEDRLGEFGFDPRRASLDRDRDGVEAGQERRLGTRDDAPDSDGDGWGDFDETLNLAFGFDPRRATADRDFDGLSDELERRIKSDPGNADSNADGISDFTAFAAGLNPNEKAFPDEMLGTSYSPAMAAALVSIRAGGAFPAQLANQLPYPIATEALAAAGRIRPSAALMQRAAYNPHNSPGLYPSYAEITARLTDVVNKHHDIARLFYWSELTLECCTPVENANKPGRRIYALKISDNPDVNENEPEVLLLGAHHGRETISAVITLDMVERLAGTYATDPAIKTLVNGAEIWVIAVVNPNGYDRTVVALDSWRKNTRRVNQAQQIVGVDVNRNYDADHINGVSLAARQALSPRAKDSNGLDLNGQLNWNLISYPGPKPFSEVESQAVAGLAHNQFLTRTRDEVDGLGCALSWHSYTGLALHPLGHPPIAPAPGLATAARSELNGLSKAYADATGYLNVGDGFADLVDPFPGYPVFGDAGDWLFRDGKTLAISVEAYSRAEGQVFQVFSPGTAADRDKVSRNNQAGALAVIRACGA